MPEIAEQIRREAQALIESRLSLEIATVSESGLPAVSYAPYVCSGQLTFYVMLSDLAAHTANIAANSMASMMIIADESESPNLFARERLIADCTVKRHPRDSDQFRTWFAAYRDKFGNIADTLAQLADFNLYSFRASEGTYIKGFGQAYRISGENMAIVEHIQNPASELNNRKQRSP